MNLFTRNSPYYHLLKYLLFLLKHPVYIYIYIYIYALHVSAHTYFHRKASDLSQIFPLYQCCRVSMVFLINQGKQCSSCYYGCLFYQCYVCCIDYHVYANVPTFSDMFLSYTCVHPFSQVTRTVQTTLVFCSSI